MAHTATTKILDVSRLVCSKLSQEEEPGKLHTPSASAAPWKCSADPDWTEVFPGIEPEQYECTCPGNRRNLRFGYSAEVGCCIDLNKIEYTPP